MEKESYEVSGERVDRLVPAVRNAFRADSERSESGHCVLVFERKRGFEVEVLTVTVVVFRLDETTARVDVVVGGGKSRLLLATPEEQILDSVCERLDAIFEQFDLTATRPGGRSWEGGAGGDETTSSSADRDRSGGPFGDESRDVDRGRSRTSGVDPDDRDLAHPGADAVVDPRCDVCGLTLEAVAFECDHCGGVFCREHCGTDDHDCVGSVSFYTTIELDSD